ncbi:MAG: anthranilate synthase component 1 [Pseudomonadota bacterium]|nr:anthranilate synthase component 1 [Pseudomonadota bacterium]
MSDIRTGTAQALTRRLPRQVDLLAVYAQLTEGGTRPDTLLLETRDGASILLEQAAVRIECRGQQVALEALTPNGAAVLRIVEGVLAHAISARSPERLVVRFERTHAVDAEKRLLAPSPFDALRAIVNSLRSETPEEPFTICLVGGIAFDHVDLFEELPQQSEDPTEFPDFVFWLAESAVIAEPGLFPRLVCTSFASDDEDSRRGYFAAVERLTALGQRSSTVTPVEQAQAITASPDIAADLDDEAFADVVSQLKEHILAGDVYQIVPSRTFRAPCPDPLAAFARLRSIDRSPYMFFARLQDSVLFGASPETSVRVLREEGVSTVEVKPIAGTRPRGTDRDDDDRMEADLRLDQKEVAEHMMLVDLARNDVARISITGTRRVDGLMTVERYARVMHLVSSVKGELSASFDALHALAACLNVGTLSGAPKLKAIELLRRYEHTRRGPYGGAIGWLSGEGLMDTGVIIRSALVMDGTAYVRAGAGVVHDSDPMAEADETRRKASAVLSAITGAAR